MRELQVVAVLDRPVQGLAVVPAEQGWLLAVAHPDHPGLVL